MAAHVRRARLGYETGVVTTEIARTSQLLSYLTGHVPQPNKAIVGRNAFAHESGIHQHGMLADGATYEIMRPETVGLAKSRLVLGKHSGRHALARRLRDLGHDVDETRLDAIYQRFSALADRKREILDEDLLMLVHESFGDVPEAFELVRLDVHCGSVAPSAQVTLRGPWTQARTATGTGDGPIAAAFAAVSEIVGATVEVESLGLHSITPGRDSIGQVFLQASVDGRTFSAHGASTDIVEACVHALVNALNKARHAEHLEQAAHDATYLWGV
jgi:2-isopropylmalate synthase